MIILDQFRRERAARVRAEFADYLKRLDQYRTSRPTVVGGAARMVDAARVSYERRLAAAAAPVRSLWRTWTVCVPATSGKGTTIVRSATRFEAARSRAAYARNLARASRALLMRTAAEHLARRARCFKAD